MRAGWKRHTQLGVKDYSEDNLSKEQAVVYFGQIGAKMAQKRN